MKEDRGASVQTRLTNGGVLIMDVGAVHLKVVGEHLDLISRGFEGAKRGSFEGRSIILIETNRSCSSIKIASI